MPLPAFLSKLENLDGVETHENGRIFEFISETFRKKGDEDLDGGSGRSRKDYNPVQA